MQLLKLVNVQNKDTPVCFDVANLFTNIYSSSGIGCSKNHTLTEQTVKVEANVELLELGLRTVYFQGGNFY